MRWALVLLLLALPAGAGGLWQGFTSFAAPDPEPELPAGPGYAADGAFLCERAIQGAEARHGLPRGLLMQIGLTEAGHRGGVWPWTVNAEGQSHYFDSRAEAVQFVAAREAAGMDRIDTGCLQVNRYWHRDAFPDLEAAFDPERNADYAARYLASLRQEFGSWEGAVGAYHSRNPDRNAGYRARVASAQDRARALADRMSVERFAIPASGPNLLPALSADLDQVDAVAIAKLAQRQPRHLARRSTRPSTEARAPLPDPKPGQGHALFATGGGSLLPAKVKPLY